MVQFLPVSRNTASAIQSSLRDSLLWIHRDPAVRTAGLFSRRPSRDELPGSVCPVGTCDNPGAPGPPRWWASGPKEYPVPQGSRRAGKRGSNHGVDIRACAKVLPRFEPSPISAPIGQCLPMYRTTGSIIPCVPCLSRLRLLFVLFARAKWIPYIAERTKTGENERK